MRARVPSSAPWHLLLRGRAVLRRHFPVPLAERRGPRLPRPTGASRQRARHKGGLPRDSRSPGTRRLPRLPWCAMVGLDVGRLMGYEMIQGVP
jgi:hypothetical protein